MTRDLIMRVAKIDRKAALFMARKVPLLVARGKLTSAFTSEKHLKRLLQYDDLVDERDTERQPIQIPNDQRTTDPQMTHYEKIRLLGIRTKQISMGAKVMVKYDGQLGPL